MSLVVNGVREGSSGGGGDVTADAIVDAVADPADAAVVNAALGNGPVANDLSAATTTNGTGTASKVGATAVLSMLAAATGTYQSSGFTGPRVLVPNLAKIPGVVRVYARLAATNGDNNTWAYFGIVGEDPGQNRFRGWRVRCDNGQAGVRVDASTTTTPGTIAVDGTGWLLYQRDEDGELWAYGNGTTTDPPSTWSPGAVATNTTRPDNFLALALVKTDTAVAGGCTWADVHVENL